MSYEQNSRVQLWLKLDRNSRQFAEDVYVCDYFGHQQYSGCFQDYNSK